MMTPAALASGGQRCRVGRTGMAERILPGWLVSANRCQKVARHKQARNAHFHNSRKRFYLFVCKVYVCVCGYESHLFPEVRVRKGPRGRLSI